MQLETFLSGEEFAARLAALNAGKRFALAVSGGRDSMALARLAADYGRARNCDIRVFIVDHALRSGARAEAEQAKAWCEAMGLSARVLYWRGEKPATGVQAAARAARYFLLAKAANIAGLPAILTAHTADDQIETFLMRLARGARHGLAGMRAETMIAAAAGAPVRLLRPLLSVSRARLTETLKRCGQSYIDDPSNDDMRFERVRVRKRRIALEREGAFDAPGVLRAVAAMQAAADSAGAEEIRAFHAFGGVFTRWGGVSLEAGRIGSAGHAAPGLAARLVRAVGGENYAPDPAKAAAAMRQAMETGAASLGGALLKRKARRLWFIREPAALLGRAGVAPMTPQRLRAGEATLWDRRFVVSGADGLIVAPLGDKGLEALGAARALFEGPVEGLKSAPGLFRGGRLIGVPGVLFRESAPWRAAPLAEERFGGGIVRFLQESTAFLDDGAEPHGAALS